MLSVVKTHIQLSARAIVYAVLKINLTDDPTAVDGRPLAGPPYYLDDMPSKQALYGNICAYIKGQGAAVNPSFTDGAVIACDKVGELINAVAKAFS